MKLQFHPICRNVIAYSIAILSLCFVPFAAADGTADTPTISGDIQNIGGIKVLRVHGDPRDRGFAYGYLLADDILELLDGYLSAEAISGGAAQFKTMKKRLRKIMDVPPTYLNELRGMLAGIKRKRDGDTTVPRLGRNLKLSDLVTMNCIPDAVGFGCSSFAAWGRATANGHTIAGRNLDWHSIDVLRDSQIVVATIPAEDESAAAWLTVTWPGMIGCFTGMNENGIGLSMHDGFADVSRQKSNLTPRGLVLRSAIESAKTGSFTEDVLSILARHRVLVSNIVPVVSPMKDGATPSVIFEYDGIFKNIKGVTAREPGDEPLMTGNGWQVATNHFRSRATARPCRRYDTLASSLRNTGNDDHRITTDNVWNLLRQVSEKGNLTTYHSVVFEPNSMKMHVSFCSDGRSAPTDKRVELDVSNLLERPRLVSKNSKGA